MFLQAGGFRLSAMFLALAAVPAGCGSDPETTPTPTPTPVVPVVTPPGSSEGLGDLSNVQALLAANCTIVGTVMTGLVADGETAYLSMRASDSKIILNATLLGGAPCELATGTVSIKSTGTAQPVIGRTVLLDYITGLFAKGVGTVPGVVIDLSVMGKVTTLNTLKVQGQAGDDYFAFGAGAAAGVYAFNINAGPVVALASPALDLVVDVTFKDVQTVIINTGAGLDMVTGAGGALTTGTGLAFPNPLIIYGGANVDTLTGGDGNDTIIGGIGNDIMEGGKGNDIFKMGLAADGTDTINAATTPTGSDTVDYSGRTTALVINIDGTATSGDMAMSENDTISDKIVSVLAGTGNDTITVLSTSTVAHSVFGGAGNDTFTGGLGADVFEGDAGDDVCLGATTAMSYAERTALQPVTVTVCDPSGTCTASNQDGDQTMSVKNAGAAAATAAVLTTVVTVSVLTGLTAADVGRRLTLTGFTVALNNNASTGYIIQTVPGSTSATLLASAFSDTTDLTPSGAGLTWTIKGHEQDNVTCANVTGGLGVDTITGDARTNIIRGGDGVDTIVGGDGDDTVYGGIGNDNITGGLGDDTLNGDADDDTIYGGDGNDTINGGAGVDTMIGGDGDDVLGGEGGIDTFTCDGLNAVSGAGSASAGAAFVGDADFTVDFLATSTTVTEIDVWGGGTRLASGCDF
jgi:Ca2+-binding RTX toxin-like protein